MTAQQKFVEQRNHSISLTEELKDVHDRLEFTTRELVNERQAHVRTENELKRCRAELMSLRRQVNAIDPSTLPEAIQMERRAHAKTKCLLKKQVRLMKQLNIEASKAEYASW